MFQSKDARIVKGLWKLIGGEDNDDYGEAYGAINNGGINTYIPYSPYGYPPLYERLFGSYRPYTPKNPLEPAYYIKRNKHRDSSSGSYGYGS